VDLTDLADAAGKKYGGWIPAAKSLVEVEGRWYGLPIFYILAPMLYRKDLFDANNLKYPDTWELARVAARTLKPKGHPTGIALSQCADANLFWRSMFFSFGGTEAEPSGANPTLDSKELREFLTFAKALFNEGMTPEVFSWDDASDNRYLASAWPAGSTTRSRRTAPPRTPILRCSRTPSSGSSPRGCRQAGQRGRAQRLDGVEVLQEPASGEGMAGVPHRQRPGGDGSEPRLQHAVSDRPLQEADARHRDRPQAADPPGLPEDRRVLRLSGAVDHPDPGDRQHLHLPRHGHSRVSRQGKHRGIDQVGSRRVPAVYAKHKQA